MHAATPPAPSLRCAVGLSTQPRIEMALAEATSQALLGLDAPTGPITSTLPADLAVVFVSSAYGQSIRPALETLGEQLRVPALIGTTAEGVLAGDTEIESEPAVVVWLARLPGASIVPLALEYQQTPDGGMFVGWPAELSAGWPEEASLLLVADTFSFPVDTLIRRFEERAGQLYGLGLIALRKTIPACRSSAGWPAAAMLPGATHCSWDRGRTTQALSAPLSAAACGCGRWCRRAASRSAGRW